MLAQTPRPPYYVVIFTSQRTDGDNGYSDMATRMEDLAARQRGYLGIESIRASDGSGITVSYWDSLEAIAIWKQNTTHQLAQTQGRNNWYTDYMVRVAKVERAYGRST
jgi:heme-degrading monooxygenase HmoA